MNFEIDKEHEKKLVEFLGAVQKGNTSWSSIAKEMKLDYSSNLFLKIRGLAEGLKLIELNGKFLQNYDSKRITKKGKKFLEKKG